MKGFEYMGKKYVWHKKDLYRLPFQSGMNFYGILKCKKWTDRGYLLGAHRKSFSQLESMTVDVEHYEIEKSTADTPF